MLLRLLLDHLPQKMLARHYSPIELEKVAYYSYSIAQERETLATVASEARLDYRQAS
jgi:hypothetical protein